MQYDKTIIDALRATTTATLTTVLLKKGIRALLDARTDAAVPRLRAHRRPRLHPALRAHARGSGDA